MDNLIIAKALIIAKKYNPTPVVNPQLIIIAGQPGAGKTTITNSLNQELFSNNSAILDWDEYVEMYPDYLNLLAINPQQAVLSSRTFIRTVAYYVLLQLLQGKYNLILENTLSDLDLMNMRINLAIQFRYQIKVFILTINLALSKISHLYRYENWLKNNHCGARPSIMGSDIISYHKIPEAIQLLSENQAVKIILINRANNILVTKVNIMQTYLKLRKVTSVLELEEARNKLSVVFNLLNKRHANEQDKLEARIARKLLNQQIRFKIK